MATNHTQEISVCDALAAQFLWKYKRKTKVSSAAVKHMAAEGIISMSNLLERVLLDNGNLTHSNKIVVQNRICFAVISKFRKRHIRFKNLLIVVSNCFCCKTLICS